MKRKDDTIAILFVTLLAVLIWLWSAARTEDDRTINTTLHFVTPEGSTSSVTPESKPIRLTVKGSRTSLNEADEACKNGLFISIAADDGVETIDIASRIIALSAIHSTGIDIISTEPSAVTLTVQTMINVEVAVEPLLPGVTVSGDVTVDPATVTLRIPKQFREQLPEAMTVTAVVSESNLEQLQPGFVNALAASIQLPADLNARGIVIEPNRVSLSFKIQSKTYKATLPQVRVLLAGPAEDYAAYSVSLPVKIIPNVTVEADVDLITKIASGDITVFAILRLASRDMEQRIESKRVTSFMAILEDGTGVQLNATPDDASTLDVTLQIEPIQQPTQ